MSGLATPSPERSFRSAAVSTETAAAGGVPPPERPYDGLRRLFDALIETQHAAIVHHRACRHLPGASLGTCTACADHRLLLAQARSDYDTAWHDLFDSAPPPARGLGAPGG